MEKKAFIADLLSAINKGRFSIFAGAGLSVESGLPTWKKLFKEVALRLNMNIDNVVDYYELAQFYCNLNGELDLRLKVYNAILVSPNENSLANEIVNLPVDSFWTSNFDNVLERSIEKSTGNIPNVIQSENELAKVGLVSRVNVFKLNGDVSNEFNMVLTKNDLDNYILRHKTMLTFFKKELVSNTFLFIGYSFTDSLVIPCISEILSCLGEACGVHYTIMKRQKTTNFKHFINNLEKSYHIKTLLVNNYSEIPEIIKQLNRTIVHDQVFISGSYDLIPREKENFADTLSRELTNALIENGYRICTGVGKKLGTLITGYAYRHMFEKNIVDTNKKLIMRPFPFHLNLSPAEKYTYRENMMKGCGCAIFAFGKSENNPEELSHGVFQEFEIAKTNGMIIIPIDRKSVV